MLKKLLTSTKIRPFSIKLVKPICFFGGVKNFILLSTLKRLDDILWFHRETTRVIEITTDKIITSIKSFVKFGPVRKLCFNFFDKISRVIFLSLRPTTFKFVCHIFIS